MQMQPSAQGIASLYTGNPGALQQKIQKEQQAKPGMPPDLKKLMALNIVTNEEDAGKRQQAMNALNSMAPAGQEPPTVAQSIQEQAKQKMQAKMLQEQRQQQGLMALAQRQPAVGVPENVPRPEAQPQGIDDLPVDMEFAGGGIVAFAAGDQVKAGPEFVKFLRQMGLDYIDFAKSSPEVQANIKEMFKAAGPAAAEATSAAQAAAPAAQAAAAPARKGILGLMGRLLSAPVTVGTGILEGGTRASEYAADTLAAATPEQRRDFYKNPMVGAMGGDTALAAAILNEGAETQERADAVKNQPQKVTVGTPTRQSLDDKIAPRRSIEEIMAEQAPRRAPTARPTATPTQAPAAQAVATPVDPVAVPAEGLSALYEQNLKKRMELDPEARANAMRARLESTVGRPDTSEIDRLMAELESRKKQFDAPKPGFEAFAEYMQQIAAAGPRRTVGEAGTAGAMALDALNKERRAQQFDLTKQGIEAAQKKLDLDRAYKKELFTLTEKERDEVDKMVGEATKEYGLSKRDADKYKRDVELKVLEHKQQMALESARGANALEAARINADARVEGRTTMTPAQRAEIANKAKDNVQNELKTDMRLQMEVRKNPGLAAILVQRETERLMAAAEGRTMAPAPGAASPGGNTRLRFDAQGNQIK